MGDDPHAAGENNPQQKLKGMKKRRLEKRIREKNGAGDGIRTHDNHVGNVMLYP